MAKRIDKDQGRFKKIVSGKLRKDLKKYITSGELVARKRGGSVRIPLPQIQPPRFRFGSNEGGVGQGEGQPGDPIDGESQPGQGEAGDGAGDHQLEVDVSLEELASLLGEELDLPRIEAKGKKHIETIRSRFTGIRQTGPESLRHFKRTYKEGLRRAIASGTYDAEDPIIIPQREDKRYRSWQTTRVPESSAVILYMMDVSGSMGEEQKDIVRSEAFWIDTWLRSQYRNIESVYIVHDSEAREVDEHTFYHLSESGGTKISSAYTLAKTVVEARFNPQDWNIYLFHFSDGDNWGSEDTALCSDLLKDYLLPASNLFGYGQVRSAYGSGKFKGDLDELFVDDERVITSDILDREGIMNSIKDFLGKGR